MTEYRAVSRHVRYWRGVIHRWSTVWPLTGSLTGAGAGGIIATIHDYENAILYPSPTGHGGGIYEVAVYDQASGGVPIQVGSFFDPDTPSGWSGYNGGGWSNLANPLESAAEVALQVEWLGGLSKSGKPVRYRKWFHSVPTAGTVPGSPDVSGTDITGLEGQVNALTASFAPLGVLHGRSSRLAASTCTVVAEYGNHQMPRGRKKKVTKISSDVVKLPPGLLVVPGSDGSLDS